MTFWCIQYRNYLVSILSRNYLFSHSSNLVVLETPLLVLLMEEPFFNIEVKFLQIEAFGMVVMTGLQDFQDNEWLVCWFLEGQGEIYWFRTDLVIFKLLNVLLYLINYWKSLLLTPSMRTVIIIPHLSLFLADRACSREKSVS